MRDPGSSTCGFVGTSAHAEDTRRLMAALAPEAVTVCVIGPTGCGKSVIAHALHRPERPGPMVRVAAPRLDDALVANELLGHAREAFTSAVRDRTGILEQAAGGTLFVDDADDLGDTAQGLLLDIAERVEVRPLGASRGFLPNVRMVECFDPVGASFGGWSPLWGRGETSTWSSTCASVKCAIADAAFPKAGLAAFAVAAWYGQDCYKDGSTCVEMIQVGVPLWLGGPGGSPGLARGIAETVRRAQGADVTFRLLGRFTEATWRIPGSRNGFVIWNRILDSEGRTVRLFKDVYNRAHRWIRRDPYWP